MKVLIVGGFGFIGKHLVENALAKNISFTVIARKDPDVPWVKYPYILENSLDDDAFQTLAAEHDALVYLASSSIPATGSFLKEFPTNVEPAVQLVERLTYHNPELKVIYLSSGGQVYGNGYKRPMKESDNCEPMSPYGFGKLMTEQSLSYLHRSRGTKIAILRVANPVGKWQVGLRQGLVNVVYQSLMLKEPLKIFGTGAELRDYIDVDELAQLIIKVASMDFDLETWNVGSGVGTATIQLVEKIESFLGIEGEKVFLPRRPVDPESAVLNCEKIEKQLGWKARMSIDDVLEKTLNSKLKTASF